MKWLIRQATIDSLVVMLRVAVVSAVILFVGAAIVHTQALSFINEMLPEMLFYLPLAGVVRFISSYIYNCIRTKQVVETFKIEFDEAAKLFTYFLYFHESDPRTYNHTSFFKDYDEYKRRELI